MDCSEQKSISCVNLSAAAVANNTSADETRSDKFKDH